MSDISKIDPNLKVETKINVDGLRFYNITQAPFKIYGIFYENGKYRRLPETVEQSVSEGVYGLHTNTAGGRVRFKTDSPYIAINAKMPNMGRMPHFALTGSMGLDLYVRKETENYTGTFVPPYDAVGGYESIIYLGSSEMREITMNFPLYSDVSELNIGLKEGASIAEPTAYKISKPIVFYGSSITQGGCASRPGNSYQSIVSRRLDFDYINLGFSGSAKAEDEMIEYVKKLDMSVFVYDYDHNAPDVEHLNNTHEKMFTAIRENNPDLPIIIMSRPKYTLSKDEQMRFEIIKTTYDNAVARGDKNVYLIDGKTLMELAENDGTVDNCHPNDLGFMSMANAVTKVLKEII